jgi:nitrate reductase delta subunit
MTAMTDGHPQLSSLAPATAGERVGERGSRDAQLRELCGAFSELLSYPRDGLPARARRCAALTGPGTPAGAALARFAAFAEAAGPAALEELYTSTFDLRPACAPYVGVQLVGEESPLRGPLLAKLAELYAAEGHAPREELPDHVAEVLAFAAVARPGPARDDLLADGLVPAVGRMVEALDGCENPYRDVLAALRENLP